MRYLKALLLALLGLLPLLVGAQSTTGIFVKVVIRVSSAPAGGTATLPVVCPTGWYPTYYGMRPYHDDAVSVIGNLAVNHSGNPLDIASIDPTTGLSGAGYATQVQNNNPGADELFEGYTWCFSPSAFTNGVPSFVRQTVTVAAGATGSIAIPCPSGQNAVGGYGNGSQSGMIPQGDWPVFPTGPLGNQPDGITGLPTGFGTSFLNISTTAKTV